MTMTVRVYGASDDIIRIDGELSEELYVNCDGVAKIKIGKWVIQAMYGTDAIWHLQVDFLESEAGGWEHYEAGHPQGAKDYSEMLVLPVGEDVRVKKFIEEDVTVEKIN